MREQLLKALQSKHLASHFFLPLCWHNFFDAMPEYVALQREGEVGPEAGERDDLRRSRFFRTERALAYRMRFLASVGAAFLDWCSEKGFTTRLDPSIVTEQHIEGQRTTTVYKTPVGSLWSAIDYSSVAATSYPTEPLLKTVDDARIYRYMVEASVSEPTPERAQRWLELVNDAGVCGGAGCAPPFHELLHAYGAERFLVMAFELPSEIRALMDCLHRRNVERCRVLARSPYCLFDHECLWDARLISPQIFRDHYKPCLAEYNRILHEAGKFCMDHASGQEIDGYLEDLEECGYDLIYGLRLGEDNLSDGAELLQRWQGRMVGCLGPDPDFLRRHSEARVRELCRGLLDRAAGLKLLMGTSDAVVAGTPPGHLKAIADELGINCSTTDPHRNTLERLVNADAGTDLHLP
jgi:hypothetical protein